jgi:hypothetical protein
LLMGQMAQKSREKALALDGVHEGDEGVRITS